MYLMRLSYDLLPANREKAVALIRREVEAAKARGLRARLLSHRVCRGDPTLDARVQ